MPTVIEIWFAEHPLPQYMAPIIRIAEQFELAHPDYRLDIQAHDFRTIPGKIVRAADAGHRPAIAEYYSTATQLAYDSRGQDGRPLFTSVQRAIDGRSRILGEPVVIDDIEPVVRDYYTQAGELTSLPATATTTLLFSNKSALSAAGIDRAPETWADVEAACAAMATLRCGPAHGITWPNHGWLFQQAIAGQGGLLCDHDNGRTGRATAVDLASKEMLDYITWWRGLHENGYYLDTAQPWDWGLAIDAFVRGRVAMLLCSSVLSGALVEMGAGAGFQVEVSRQPYNDRTAHAGDLLSGQSLFLADGLDQVTQDGALAFLQYLINPRNAAEWHKASGFLPVTRASYDLLEQEGWLTERPQHRMATEQIRESSRSPAALGAVVGDFAGIQHMMTDAMTDVLSGGTDPVARFTEATTAAQRLLDEYNARCAGPAPRSPGRFAVA
jgi:sn-glycerol 3-phosphate transport system substrate-binding protein